MRRFGIIIGFIFAAIVLIAMMLIWPGKTKVKIENQVAQKNMQSSKVIEKLNIMSFETQLQTKNYLIVNVRNNESDLSIYKLQNFYDAGWELMAANYRVWYDGVRKSRVQLYI